PVPKWQQEGMEQAQASVRGLQLPVLILHSKGASIDDCLVQIKLSDFRDWFISDEKYLETLKEK
ncbi:MAG: hypothetical protein ACC651_17390, partial [Candidatus Scalindua sp.]